eukprot:4742416-Prymnesium_polylepis.2
MMLRCLTSSARSSTSRPGPVASACSRPSCAARGLCCVTWRRPTRPVWGVAFRTTHAGSRGATVLLPRAWSLATLLLTLPFPFPNWSSRTWRLLVLREPRLARQGLPGCHSGVARITPRCGTIRCW